MREHGGQGDGIYLLIPQLEVLELLKEKKKKGEWDDRA